MRLFLLSILAFGVLMPIGPPGGAAKNAVAVTAGPLGWTHQQQAAAETRLRDAGLRIDPRSKSRLNVTIGVSDIRHRQRPGLGYVCSVHLSVSKQMYLAHNTNILTDAVTW